MATDTAAVDLYERLTDLLGTHDVHPADRKTIRDAYYDGATWDDPSDVPDHIFTD